MGTSLRWPGSEAKALASKTDNLNLVPGTHMVEGENQISQAMEYSNSMFA